MSVSEAFRLVMDAVIETNQDKAVRFCKEAIKLDPGSKLANYHLGMIYAGRGLYELAIEQYKKIITDIDPNDPGIWFLLSRQYHLNGQFKEAVRHYKKTFELDPLCEKACLYISKIYYTTQEKHLEALYYAKKSLQLRTAECMVDKNEFLLTLEQAQLLVDQREADGTTSDRSELQNLRSNLSSASLEKLTALNPDLIDVFKQHGIRCIGCAGYEDETVEEAARANNSNLEALLSDLDEALFSSR